MRMDRYGLDGALDPGLRGSRAPSLLLPRRDWHLSRRSESTWFLLRGSQLFFSPPEGFI